MSIINRETSKKTTSKKIIRFINNRIHLEEPEIRAAAVGTLSKFGVKYPELKEGIANLISLYKSEFLNKLKKYCINFISFHFIEFIFYLFFLIFLLT